MSIAAHTSPVEELANFLARRPTYEEIAHFRLSPAAIAQAQDLMDKNKAGTLTAEEAHELDRMILLDDIIGLIQTRVPAKHDDSRPDEVTAQDDAAPQA